MWIPHSSWFTGFMHWPSPGPASRPVSASRPSPPVPQRFPVGRVVGTDRDEQVTAAGTDRSAGVGQGELLLCELTGHLAHHVDPDGGGEQDDSTRIHDRNHTIGSPQHLGERIAVADGQKNDVRVRSRLLCAARGRRESLASEQRPGSMSQLRTVNDWAR